MKALEAFEAQSRFGNPVNVCIPCRYQQKAITAAKRKAGPKLTPREVSQPSACSKCGKAPGGVVKFNWRAERWTWTTACVDCVNKQTRVRVAAARAMAKAEDAEKFFARNRAAALARRDANPELVQLHHYKDATIPTRRLNTSIVQLVLEVMLMAVCKVDLWASNCYLCGFSPAFGIDRFDSNGDYTLENSRSCCTTCNMMKHSWSLSDFLEYISHILAHTRDWTLSDVKDLPMLVCKTFERVPVVQHDRDFPGV
ncbi:hypothetical protein V8C86DRAFT_3085180 [Haematococcus lacustris]